jgi:hypothetical protein
MTRHAHKAAPPETFGFRLSFFLPPGCIFKGVHPTRRLRFAGVDGRVYLVRPAQSRRHRFGARTKYLARGTLFESQEAARRCGAKLKLALGLFAADRQLGLDAGSDRATLSISRSMKDAILASQGVQLRDTIHGLDTYPEHPTPGWMGAEAYGTVRRTIEDFDKPLQTFYRAQLACSAKQRLALDLYNLSHFEGTAKTRFLTLITVVEVLAERPKRPSAVRALLAGFRTTVRSSPLDEADRRRLTESIGSLSRESIGSACRGFVVSHATPEDGAYFAACYRARSDLVHDGQTSRPQATDPTQLDALVSRLVIRSLAGAV